MKSPIGLREGCTVLAMPNDVLFDSGRFQVAGHTDNVPIQTDRFASNWELSAARALAVIHFFAAEGVAPTVLSAAGYGEFDPVASNDDKDGRRRNRRIEITLQPNIDELIAVP